MRRGPGCTDCKLTGYVDRVAVAEVFTPTDAMRVAIAKGITALELKQQMKEAGHRSMRDAAMRLVDEGVTSLDEVNRVLVEDEGERTETPGSGRGRQEARARGRRRPHDPDAGEDAAPARRLRGAGSAERAGGDRHGAHQSARPADYRPDDAGSRRIRDAGGAALRGKLCADAGHRAHGGERSRGRADGARSGRRGLPRSSRSTARSCYSGCAAYSCDTCGSPARTTSSRRSPAPGRWRSSSARARC